MSSTMKQNKVELRYSDEKYDQKNLGDYNYSHEDNVLSNPSQYNLDLSNYVSKLIDENNEYKDVSKEIS